MNQINVGIIGFGLSGRVFHASLLKACPEYYISKVFTSRADEVQSYLPDSQCVGDLDSVFEDPTIDLVILSGPNHTHYDQAKRALLNGKHVVVEKPFVSEISQGEELIKIAKENGCVLSVFQNRRFDSDFLTIKKLIKEDRIGQLKLFESHFDRWRPINRQGKWKENPGEATGILYDLGSHLIDQAITLFGMPEEVFADLDDQKDNKGVIDYFHLLLRYKNNNSKLKVVLNGSSFSLHSPRFILQGDSGNYLKYGLDPQESRLAEGRSAGDEDLGLEDSVYFGELIYDEKNDGSINRKRIISEKGDYLYFYQSLAKAIKSGNHEYIPVSATSALDTIRVIKACESSMKNRSWARLN